MFIRTGHIWIITRPGLSHRKWTRNQLEGREGGIGSKGKSQGRPRMVWWWSHASRSPMVKVWPRRMISGPKSSFDGVGAPIFHSWFHSDFRRWGLARKYGYSREELSESFNKSATFARFREIVLEASDEFIIHNFLSKKLVNFFKDWSWIRVPKKNISPCPHFWALCSALRETIRCVPLS